MKHASPIIAAVAMAALTACSGEQPAPLTTALTTNPSTLDIPKVAKPLESKAFVADPCGLLTEANRTELGLPTSTRNDTACDLYTGPAEPKPLELLHVRVMADRGLAAVYAQCGTSASARCDTWTVDSVAGYPLIRANGDTERKYGSCKQFLGISDQATILINDVRTGKATTPDCARSDRTAAMVIANLTR